VLAVNYAGYFMLAGILLVIVGLIFRSANRISPRLRIPMIVLVIIFGAAPYSWLPWGLALVSIGVAVAPVPSVASAISALLAVLLFLVGVIFFFWRPRWMLPADSGTSSWDGRQ
jgi:hypothetical protein